MSIKNTNPRLGTINNLQIGGTYDILMFMYPDGFPEGRLAFGFDTTPRKITGVQKVAQVFAKLLTTTKGSDVIYPNRGTAFPLLVINANNALDSPALAAEITVAVKDAESQTKAGLNSSTDSSSKLAGVSILGLDVVDDGVTLYLNIETQDGVTAQVAVPFPEQNLS
jgi:hypothetical protein